MGKSQAITLIFLFLHFHWKSLNDHLFECQFATQESIASRQFRINFSRSKIEVLKRQSLRKKGLIVVIICSNKSLPNRWFRLKRMDFNAKLFCPLDKKDGGEKLQFFINFQKIRFDSSDGGQYLLSKGWPWLLKSAAAAGLA